MREEVMSGILGYISISRDVIWWERLLRVGLGGGMAWGGCTQWGLQNGGDSSFEFTPQFLPGLCRTCTDLSLPLARI